MRKRPLDKINHPFVRKTLKKQIVEENFLNYIDCTYEKSIAIITLNGKRLKAFPLTLARSNTKITGLTFLFNIQCYSQGN